ncbi:tetratricopeptide (TPR) repeat protein [Sphingobacterium zeae]|uniref:Tetratricopeptide (TPR) repeat protein n=1 Tax=Sphingobacterium zeae TaxID=1776859 RepID=A0ABU0U7B8_9SPHI|nr:RagB/SusD family nutrient uptake outer membrane protein [Sphingobacterium zeae]MDQ1150860.1 tetratricopeptide (TPR) repeat protein [Sphingobacterium zeae]
MKRYPILFITALLFTLTGCDKFLDKKADLKMAIPESIEDGEALMDNYSMLNQGYPYIGELCSDNFQMSYSDWSAITIDEDRDLFVWNIQAAPPATQWSAPYRVVYNANQVLAMMDELPSNDRSQQLKGKALFFRAYAHLALGELFVDVPRADKSNANKMAIPYRKTPNIEERSPRVTIGEFYEQLLADLLSATELLKDNNDKASRPSYTASLALLARVYLYLQDYEQAAYYADKCLQRNASLLDFNVLNQSSNTPISRFNTEVLFQAISSGSATYTRTRWKVSAALMETYQANDLRRTVFFINNNDGTYSFKGNYDGVLNQAPFSGLAVDEIYLIRAESNARLGKIALALKDINDLLRSRWKSGTYTDRTDTDQVTLLNFILQERRKELIMRQRRWPDLKRLNLKAETEVTLKRSWPEKLAELHPNAPQYTFLISFTVLNNSSLTQTER